MTFKIDLVNPVEGLVRHDLETGRVYKKGDKTYRSVTNVLSGFGNKEWLKAWRANVGEVKADGIVRQSANRGSVVHKLCENYLLGAQTNQPVMPIYLDDFNKAKRVLDKSVKVVRGVELQLYSDEINAAGTTDLFCDWDASVVRDKKAVTVPAVVDFKTKRSTMNVNALKMHFIQGAAYAIMINEIYGIFVPKLVIISLEQDSPVPVLHEARTIDFYEKTKQIFKSIK